jgi:hypothetical protein
MSDANKYRCEAEDCRRNSESAVRPIDREAWLRLAADYGKLAEGAELTQRLKDISRRSGDSCKRIEAAGTEHKSRLISDNLTSPHQ